MSKVTIASALVGVSLLSSPVAAQIGAGGTGACSQQPSMVSPFGSVVCDIQNAMIGKAQPNNTLWRVFSNGATYQLSWYSDYGLIDTTEFFYTSSDCTGQPYLPTGSPGGVNGTGSPYEYAPIFAYFTANSDRNIWGTAPNTSVYMTAHSFWPEGQGYDCVKNEDVIWVFAPAIRLNTTSHGWSPPFRQVN